MKCASKWRLLSGLFGSKSRRLILPSFIHYAAILRHSSAHSLQASAHSRQCSVWCLPHSFAHCSQMSAQILQMSFALLLPKLINCAVEVQMAAHSMSNWMHFAIILISSSCVQDEAQWLQTAEHFKQASMQSRKVWYPVIIKILVRKYKLIHLGLCPYCLQKLCPHEPFALWVTEVWKDVMRNFCRLKSFVYWLNTLENDRYIFKFHAVFGSPPTIFLTKEEAIPMLLFASPPIGILLRVPLFAL